LASWGKASGQRPLSASDAACSAAAGLTAVVLLETCAGEETPTANRKQMRGARLEDVGGILRNKRKGADAVNSVCP
jgi:hypothetical protein